MILITDVICIIRNLSGGGAEKIATTLINNLPKNISRILITIYDSEVKYDIPEPPITLLKYSTNKILRKIMLPVSILKNIIVCKSESPKIVLSFLDYDNILNLITSFVCDYTPIISIHGMPSFQGSLYIGGKYIQKLQFILARIRKAKIIAVSQGVKNEIISKYNIKGEQITVLYNPIDVKTIQALSSEKCESYEFNTNTIISAGRLSFEKGQWHLIRAFAKLRETHPAKLIILGEGIEQEYLKRLVSDLNIINDVYFMVWQDNPYKWMSKSTLFVLPSLSESFGNVLVEAMACGCPVIVSDCSDGISEILGYDRKYGLIAKRMSGIRHASSNPLDEGELSLVELMKQVLDDNNLREFLSENGKERAKFFSKESRMKDYEDYLNSYL